MSRRLLVSCVVTACLGAVALANHPATFLLRNGDRVSGELSYKGGTSYTLNGRDYPSNEIALIEFVPGEPSAAELNAIPTVDNNPSEHERHVFVTRNGEVIFGKIYHISADGNTFTFDRREGGRQDISSDQLARVYVNPAGARSIYARLVNGTSAVGTTGTLAATINVPANQAWTDTGINVNAGDRVAFQASGEIQFGRTAGMTATPDGNGSMRGNYPDPSVPVGALIGKIGNGAPFGIGMQTQALGMPATGRLFLGVNDNDYSDNSGAFTVSIRR
jgi:PA-IL-like protein